MTTQDPALSAALGWPGGISNPVLDRKVLLQMVAALMQDKLWEDHRVRHLWDQAQEQAEPDISLCPQCNGPADNGFDRSFPPSPYLCTKCMAEPVAWDVTKDGRVIYDDASTDDGLLRVSGDFEDDEQRVRYAKQIVDKLNAAPPQRTMVPLTEKEILAAVGWERAAMYMKLAPNFPVDEAKKETLTNARAVEQASWEKNHGKA